MNQFTPTSRRPLSRRSSRRNGKKYMKTFRVSFKINRQKKLRVTGFTPKHKDPILCVLKCFASDPEPESH